jgi:DNA uptake protein ComE-like DNA-binding protein
VDEGPAKVSVIGRFGRRPGSEERDPPGSRANFDGAADAEARAAILRGLDDEIKRRDGELRLPRDAERGIPSETGMLRAEPPPPTAPEDDLRDRIFKLGGRAEALEASLYESQRRNWEDLRAQQESMTQRLDDLEGAVGEREAGRIEQLLDWIEGLCEEFERTRDAHAHGLEELRVRLEPVAERLAALERTARDLDLRLREIEERATASKGLQTAVVRAEGTQEPKSLLASGGRLDLNDAGVDELRELGLSVTQASRLIAQREDRGRFSSTDELDVLPGFPKLQLTELKRRVYVE